jgi:hypothetical protein
MLLNALYIDVVWTTYLRRDSWCLVCDKGGDLPSTLSGECLASGLLPSPL